jgi:hypothetical protein
MRNPDCAGQGQMCDYALAFIATDAQAERLIEDAASAYVFNVWAMTGICLQLAYSRATCSAGS